MSETMETTKAGDRSLTRIVIKRARYYLGGHRGLILLTVSALGAGLVLSWSWLVAAGLASIIVAVAPCLVMCALGLCMNRMSKSDPSAGGTPPATPGPDARQAVKAELPSEPNPPLPGSRT